MTRNKIFCIIYKDSTVFCCNKFCCIYKAKDIFLINSSRSDLNSKDENDSEMHEWHGEVNFKQIFKHILDNLEKE